MVKAKFGISTQVLQEFYTNALRKTLRPLTPDEALEWLNELELQLCATVDQTLIRVAIDILSVSSIHFYRQLASHHVSSRR
jgi:hypothetical protein